MPKLYKNAFFKIENMQKNSKYGTFKFKDFSRTFKGLEFLLDNSRTFEDFARTL